MLTAECFIHNNSLRKWRSKAITQLLFLINSTEIAIYSTYPRNYCNSTSRCKASLNFRYKPAETQQDIGRSSAKPYFKLILRSAAINQQFKKIRGTARPFFLTRNHKYLLNTRRGCLTNPATLKVLSFVFFTIFFARKQREIVALPIFACKSVKCTIQWKNGRRRRIRLQIGDNFPEMLNEKQKIGR